MKSIGCPECHEGTMRPQTLENYPTQIGGVPFTVKGANVAICDNCNFVAATSGEIKRWQAQQREHYQDLALLPTPERIEKVLKHYSLTRADLAGLLTVTRQTVQAWLTDPSLIPLGPGPMLIFLLEAEIDGKANGVYSHLATAASRRGHRPIGE